MSELSDREVEHGYVDVLINSNQRVPVTICFEPTELPKQMTVLAPDTRQMKVFASIHRGGNVYGELEEDFFVCRDNDYEPNFTILWVTQSAAQAQDNIQRLQPFCMLPTDWQPDDFDDPFESVDELEMEGMILLWAYARSTTDAWGKGFLEKAEVVEGSLNTNLLRFVVRAGIAGSPLNESLFRLSSTGSQRSVSDRKIN